MEGHRGVGEPKEHDCWFKESLRGEGCSLPFISFLDLDVIVSPFDVKLCEQGASLEVVDDLGNEWGDIPISFGPFVHWSVVLYWVYFSIFLFDKEEICSIRADGLPDGVPSKCSSMNLWVSAISAWVKGRSHPGKVFGAPGRSSIV